jgi:HAD superfamily hydrolase (TIGR01549 family)
LAGEETDERLGDEIRDARDDEYERLIGEVAPLEGARELMEDLRGRGFTVVLASSSPQKEIDHYLDLLAARELANCWTTDDDVESTKPEPDLVRAALEKAGTEEAVMVGDTPWDVEAARKAGVETVCVITGGFSEQELREAGATGVFESVEELRQRLDETPLARP